MAFESLTDEFIENLISCRKQIMNPKAREVIKPGHKQINYIVHALDESGHEFELFTRNNTEPGMEDDFSCGLLWSAPNGETLILCRYNGPSHNHRNQIDKQSLGLVCHIHRATERYIKANKKPDGFAYQAEKYVTLKEAFHCLINDCCIEGFASGEVNMNQFDLFK